MSKNKLKGILLFLSFWFYGLLFSQNNKITITGTVVNSLDDSAVPYSSVSFVNSTDDKQVFGNLCDEKGNFKIEINSGEYRITVKQTGFETYYDLRNFTENTNVGKLSLDQTSKVKTLDNVVVTAKTPVYKVELDKRVYDVSQDLTAKSGTLSDVLQNVPSVSVDVDGTVSLRGNDNVTILIDGKPSALLGISNVADALKMIPSDMVEKIETITNASARYEASGTAGIINIVTKKNRKRGVTGSVEAFAGSPQLYGSNLNIGYGNNKFNWFANAGVRYSKAKGINDGNSINFDDAGNVEERFSQNGKRGSESTGVNGSTGFNYNFDDLNSISATVNFRSSTESNLNKINYWYKFPTESASVRKEYEDETDLGLGGNFGFVHLFKKGTEHKLTIDGSLNYSTEDGDSDIYESSINPSTGLYEWQKSGNFNKQNNFMLKSDYIYPFKEGGQFEAGLRTDFKTNYNNFYLNNYDFGTETWSGDSQYTGITNYSENIYAAYAQYGNKFGGFSFLAGLRMEDSQIKVESAGMSEIKKDYTKLFPTLHLNYNLNDDNQLQISYSRRIDRPRSRDLIPFFGVSDSKSIFSGNPDLNPSYTNSFEIGYSFQKNKLNLTPSLYYQRTEDQKQMFTSRIDDNIIKTMPVNAGYQDRFGGELAYSYNPFAWWRMFGQFNFFNYKNKGSYNTGTYVQTFDSDGFSWTTRLSMNFKPIKTNTIQIQGDYRGEQKTAQNIRKAMFGMNLAVSQEMLKGKGTLLFNVQDVFNSRKRKVESFGEDFYREMEMQWRPRQFTLTFTYRFANPPKNNKKNNRPQNGDGSDDFDDMGGY